MFVIFTFDLRTSKAMGVLLLDKVLKHSVKAIGKRRYDYYRAPIVSKCGVLMIKL